MVSLLRPFVLFLFDLFMEQAMVRQAGYGKASTA
jgi:hypothetical protein